MFPYLVDDGEQAEGECGDGAQGGAELTPRHEACGLNVTQACVKGIEAFIHFLETLDNDISEGDTFHLLP